MGQFKKVVLSLGSTEDCHLIKFESDMMSPNVYKGKTKLVYPTLGSLDEIS